MKWVPPASVDAYISAQSPWSQQALKRLRSFVKSTVPQAAESIKYTVPFYTYCGLLCFLSAKKDHVVLALCEGASLNDPFEIMSGNQKQIRHVIITPRDTFPEAEIKQLLVAAARFNETKQLVKQRKR